MDVRGMLPMITGGAASAPAASAPAVTGPNVVLAQAAPPVQESAEAVPVAMDSVDTNSKMGIYLSSDHDDGLPRWKVLTALRAYGLNLNQSRSTVVKDVVAAARQVAAPAVAHEAAKASNVQQKAASEAKTAEPKLTVKA